MVIHGGPLLRPGITESHHIVNEMLGELILLTRKDSLYIQFRNMSDMSRYEGVFRNYGFEFHPHLNLIIPTIDSATTLAGISKRKLQQARQSLEAGAELVKATTDEEVSQFYRILKKVYRLRVRKPLAPESFFVNFHRASLEGKLGFILLVKYEGEVVGGMVCPLTQGKSLTEWYICGLDKKWNHVHPSILVTYGAIQYSLDHGIPCFDFLGIGKPDVPYGVRDFKMRFGGNVVDYGRYQRINSPGLYRVSRIFLSLLATFRIL